MKKWMLARWEDAKTIATFMGCAFITGFVGGACWFLFKLGWGIFK